MKLLRNLVTDRRGGAAMEYAILLGVIAVGSAAGITGLGNTVQGSYEDTASKVHNAVNN